MDDKHGGAKRRENVEYHITPPKMKRKRRKYDTVAHWIDHEIQLIGKPQGEKP